MFTLRAVRAEPSHVKLAQLPSNMALAAPWTFVAKTFVVLFAHGQLGAFLDMDVQALITILAVAVLIIELAFAHLSKVVLVEIITSISLLAQALQPMLADVVVVRAAIVMLWRLCRSWVSVGTSSTEGTRTCGSVCWTHWDCRGEGSEAVGS